MIGWLRIMFLINDSSFERNNWVISLFGHLEGMMTMVIRHKKEDWSRRERCPWRSWDVRRVESVQSRTDHQEVHQFDSHSECFTFNTNTPPIFY